MIEAPTFNFSVSRGVSKTSEVTIYLIATSKKVNSDIKKIFVLKNKMETRKCLYSECKEIKKEEKIKNRN